MWILAPFRFALQGIGEFRVKQKQPIPVMPTTTKEFGELNDFLQTMSHKAMVDLKGIDLTQHIHTIEVNFVSSVF